MQVRGGITSDEHRAHLDGVRAVAVYLVVAYHCGVDRASSGFIGVDVFFVLSGYLVTGVLLRDLEGGGSIRFGRFYARRARRLLPAAALNLIATAVVFGVIAAPIELAEAADAIRAAALYVSNWFFIARSADYFAADVQASPVIQYWSLSVEEQFYVVWPVLLGALHWLAGRAGAHRAAVMRWVVVVAGLASVAAALRFATDDLSRAYFGTDTRAYQLLAGALLALTPSLASAGASWRGARWARPISALALLVALVLLSTPLVDVGPVTRGVVVTAATAGFLVALESGASVVRTVLSWAPVAYLGRISYGTYLWHWIVIVVVDRTYDLSPIGVLAVALPVATGLASLSFQILEHPIRLAPSLDRRRGLVIGAGLALSALVGLVIAPGLLDRADDTDAEVVAAADFGTPVPPGAGEAIFDFFDLDQCPAGEARTCVFVAGDGPQILVVGDSHAGMLTPVLARIAERHDAELSGGYLFYCPWTKGLKYAGVGPTCFDEQQAMFDETIPRLDPDIVVLVHRAFDDPGNPLDLTDQDEGPIESPSPEAATASARRIGDLVDDLRRDGRQVVMVEPVPIYPAGENPLVCLTGADFVEECRFVASTGPTSEEQVMRDVARADGVWSIDLDRVVCPYLPICDPVVDGLVVRRDNDHLTTTFGREVLVDPVEAFLVANGLLEG